MKSKSKTIQKTTLDVKVEDWFKENHRIIFYVVLGVFVLFSMLYFNARVSIMGDDSSYITRAISFWHDGKFPTYQGPLYPVVLSLFIGLFGMNLILLKFTSFLFMGIFIILFYRSLVGRVSYTSLFFSLVICSISNYFLFFSSQTFSEAFFLAIQSLLFLIVYNDINSEVEPFNKQVFKKMVIIGFISFLLFITRTVGFGSLLAVVIFYLTQKKGKKSLIVIAAFLIFLGGFLLIKSAVWDLSMGMGEQSSSLMNKNPYDSSQGLETASGFVQRFVENSQHYLSMHFMRIIGFKSPVKNTTNALVTLLIYGIFILGTFRFYKKNNNLFFMAIYLAVMLGITFISLQVLWSQYRLIIPFVPYIIVFLVSTISEFAEDKKIGIMQTGFPVVLLLSVILTFSTGYKTIELSTLSRNLSGDKLVGFTPDWVSYIKAVEYSQKNFGEDSYIACRKPNIARIYAKGKKYYGIYKIPSDDADVLLDQLKQRNVTHIILASLRKNPRMYTGQSINTVQRFMAIIHKKYPNIFKLVKKYGEKEPAYIFKINYEQANYKQ